MFQDSQVKNIYHANRVRRSLNVPLASLKRILVVTIKTLESTKHWGGGRGTGTTRTFTYFGGHANRHNPTANNSHYLAKLNMCKPLDPEIPLLGIGPRATFAQMCQETGTKQYS